MRVTNIVAKIHIGHNSLNLYLILMLCEIDLAQKAYGSRYETSGTPLGSG